MCIYYMCIYYMCICIYMHVVYTCIADVHVDDRYIDVYRYVDMINMCLCTYVICVYIMYMYVVHDTCIHVMCAMYTCVHTCMCICICMVAPLLHICYVCTCMYKCVLYVCTCGYIHTMCGAYMYMCDISVSCACMHAYVCVGVYACCLYIHISIFHLQMHTWKGKASCPPAPTPHSRGKHCALPVTRSSPHTSLPFIKMGLRYPQSSATCSSHRSRQGQMIQLYLMPSNGRTISHHTSSKQCLMPALNWLMGEQRGYEGGGGRLALTSPSNSSISPPSTRMVTRFLHFTEG